MSNVLHRAAVRKTEHYHCRNPHCRSRLAHPVENERHAFCCPRCYATFYRSRCAVCEKSTAFHPLTGKRRGNRTKFCGRKCRGEAARFPRAYSFQKVVPVQGYTTSSMGKNSPAISRAKIGDLSGRPRPRSVAAKGSLDLAMAAKVACGDRVRFSRDPIDPDLWRRVLEIEVFDREWRPVASSDSVVCEVSVLRTRALVGRASEQMARWEPTGDGRDMPDPPPFLVRR
jgi:hypothetical protein